MSPTLPSPHDGLPLLIVAGPGPRAQAQAQALSLALSDAGQPALDTVPCHLLVREAARLAPQVIVAVDDAQGDALLSALDLLAASLPLPVLLVHDAGPPAPVERWLAAQVMALLPATAVGRPSVPLLQAAAQLAWARWQRQSAQDSALQGALARLDERKWVDRAKGVLMDKLQLNEGEAFALLRAASMQANLRVGEVSRGVIEAAQAAQAVNLAGQLRMLSQRCLRCLCLRVGSTSRLRADDDLSETLRRLQAILDHLAQLPAGLLAADGLGPTVAACQALRAAALGFESGPLAPRGGMPAPVTAALQAQLMLADQQAEALLAAAEALTAQLQALSGRPMLRIVNVCGRQRMLVQRLAKQALLVGLLPEQDGALQAAQATVTMREFEATLLALEQAPLATDAIRAALAQARGQWQRLLDGLRRTNGSDAAAGRAVLARESDALLAGFDQLTSLYEHSLQILMG